MNKLIKLIIGLPSGGTIRVETARDMALLLANSQVPLIFDIAIPQSCYIHMNRERCVECALEMGADYLLFIDGDMTFQSDALAKLLILEKDIAGVTYNIRGQLPKCSVIKLTEKLAAEIKIDDSITERPIPLDRLKEPFRCAAAGTGFMLIKTEVFRKIPRPWFFFTPQLQEAKAVGEDVFFCEKAISLGYDIWIDPTIKVGHIGSMIF